MTIQRDRNRLAQGIVEYALILSLMAVVVISALVILGARSANAVVGAANSFAGAGSDVPSESELTGLHVSSITLSVKATGHSTKVTGNVYVQDEDGKKARGASVSVAFSVNGAMVDSQTARTNSSGRARFTYRSGELSSGDVVALSVVSISSDDCYYDSASNAESSESAVVP